MITPLPFPPRRAWRVSLVAAVSLVTLMLAGFLLYILSGVPGLALGAGTGILLGASGFLSPRVASIQYRAYNKAVRVFTRWAITWTSLVCYFVFFRAVSWSGTGGNFKRHSPPVSNWSAVEARSASMPFPGGGRAWVTGYLSWCLKPENLWGFGLFPFLFLLSLVAGYSEDKETVPANIYTLY